MSGEAFAYAYVNVGLDLEATENGYSYTTANVGLDLEATENGYSYTTANVGLDLANSQIGYGYIYTNVDDTLIPTPHIWYLRPNFGREGWEFKVVGDGFGDPQSQYNNARVLLNALEATVVSWDLIPSALDEDPDPDRIIDSVNDDVNIEHGEIRATVPTNAVSGLVYVEHDEP